MEDREIKQKFEEVYKSRIEPNLKKLEPYRLEQKKKYDLCVKVIQMSLLLAFASDVFVFINVKNISAMSLVVLMSITCFIAMYISRKIENEYRKTIKPLLFKPVLSIFGNFKLANHEILSLKEIKSMGLYHKARNKKDDDVIWGTYNSLPIALIETELTHSETNGDHISTITDFSGLIIKVKVNKNFSGITVASQELTYDKCIISLKEMAKVHPDLFPPEQMKIIDNGLFNALGKFDEFMTKNKLQLRNGKLFIPLSLVTSNTKNKANKELEIVHVEDPEFDSNYKIYSNDQVEARYLITPSFIEKIKYMQMIFLSPSIDFAFRDGFLYLFLNNSDGILNAIKVQKALKKGQNKFVVCYENGFFEVGSIRTTLLDKEIYKDMFNELTSIFSLVDCLNLNEKTGL